jgi:hypothetical protein
VKTLTLIVGLSLLALVLALGESDGTQFAKAQQQGGPTCATEITAVTGGGEISDTACVGADPSPQIVAPAPSSVICGRIVLVGTNPNPDAQITSSIWSYSVDGGATFTTIPSDPMAPDSDGLTGINTFWDTTFVPPGAVKVNLTLSDGIVLVTDSATFQVRKPPVNGNIYVSYDANTGATSLSVQGAFDPGGTIVDYRWLLGDGYIASNPSISHLYDPGDYVVVLTTTDDSKYATTTTVDLPVPVPTPTATPPTATPPPAPVVLPVVNYCDPISVQINSAGQSTKKQWPKNNVFPRGGQAALGPINTANVAVAFSFETIFQVYGDPGLCDEFQMIKTTRLVQFKDLTICIWQNPKGGGFDDGYHEDEYTKVAGGNPKEHDPNNDGTADIAWLDAPRVYMDENVKGLMNFMNKNCDPNFDPVKNPVVKALIRSSVYDQVNAKDPTKEPPAAKDPDAAKENPGAEAVFKVFTICAEWDKKAGMSKNSKLTVTDFGGPDAVGPTITKAPNNGATDPSDWQKFNKAWAGC